MKVRHLFTHDVRPGGLFRIPTAPDNVMLDLTWVCNHRCAFCYNPVENYKRGYPPVATTEAILRTLADWGVREVLYLGGEPTLHPDFEALLGLGAELGLAQRMVTNGSRLDARMAERLAECRVEVGVSLHGSQPGVHDDLAGSQGAFQRALQSMDALVEAGAELFAQYSPTRRDNDGIEALAAFLEGRYGAVIRSMDVNRLLPFGEGGGDGREVFLDENGWWATLCGVGALVSAEWKVSVESVPRCWIRRRAEEDQLDEPSTEGILASLRPCYMGVNQLAFDPEGRVKLCPGGPPLGPSILDGDPGELWLEHPLLVERRTLSYLPKECVDYDVASLCTEFYECCGGCPSAAGVVPVAADPFGPQGATMLP